MAVIYARSYDIVLGGHNDPCAYTRQRKVEGDNTRGSAACHIAPALAVNKVFKIFIVIVVGVGQRPCTDDRLSLSFTGIRDVADHIPGLIRIGTVVHDERAVLQLDDVPHINEVPDILHLSHCAFIFTVGHGEDPRIDFRWSALLSAPQAPLSASVG